MYSEYTSCNRLFALYMLCIGACNDCVGIWGLLVMGEDYYILYYYVDMYGYIL